ncbi:MAG: glycosyltransferase [Acaryochloris sp. RU_4_1]|nr:glycosyltransferase [Acaryochloris sp. RU_4_1]NJR53976.1 glycosyltransferase [Acaryochloris sp. CRU_2_0]
MSPTAPTISVVITCYSEGALLYEAVESVLKQSQPPLEIILVNDASPYPETNQVCQDLAHNPLIRLIKRSQNGGPSGARNDGFQVAQGEILVLLDADDLLPEDALAKIQSTFAQSPSLGFMYGNYLREDQAGNCKIVNPGDISLKRMLRAKKLRVSSQWTLIGTTPLKRSVWKAVGGYDPEFEVQDLHDVEFWIRVISSECDYQYIPDCIYHWRKYLGSNSRKVTPEAWYRVAKTHLQVYTKVGLAYRANELLLLGSKWSNRTQEVKQYSQQLIKLIPRGKFQLSTLIVLLIPTWLLQQLAKRMQHKR